MMAIGVPLFCQALDTTERVVRLQWISAGPAEEVAMSRGTEPHGIKIKRAYEAPSAQDGTRVLVDRLWPRGLRKSAAAIDRWEKEVAPSPALRQWFGHDPARWDEFSRRYRAELKLKARAEPIQELRAIAREHPLTLVYAAHDEQHNHAIVLREVLLRGARTVRSKARKG
jgi:uncharacterized protein YeaO (DUF488 family)